MEYHVYFKNKGKNARAKKHTNSQFYFTFYKMHIAFGKEYSNQAHDVTLNIPRAVP
jgi:hypothetical protein